MSTEKLEKKLLLLKAKSAAFNHVLRTLKDKAEDPSFTGDTRGAYSSVWRVVHNMVRMINLAIHATEQDLKR